MTLVAGIDSSTQSCKVVIRDADTGERIRQGSAPHPPGTEVSPEAWWEALTIAIKGAGGLDDVEALAVAAQQHGMVCLDEDGQVVRDALLWNDPRSVAAAAELVSELPGAEATWAEATGSVPVASFTVAKLRWLAEHEPSNARRTAAVCLPHDWLTWRLRGALGIESITTDRGDASGTGYWSPRTNEYRTDLLELAFGATPVLPRVVGHDQPAGSTPAGVVVGPGTGDNAGAALGVGAGVGDVLVSIGTSGVISAVSERSTHDRTGMVAGFADATNRYLPLAATLNGAPVLQAAARVLGVDLGGLAELAMSAPPGAEGVVVVPYLEGERTPNRPHATGAIHGLRMSNMTPANVARATVEGLLCGLADGLDAIRHIGFEPRRILLVGGAAQNEAVRRIAPMILGGDVTVLAHNEYAADGAARQAAWVNAGSRAAPDWPSATIKTFEAEARNDIRERYADLRDLTGSRTGAT